MPKIKTLYYDIFFILLLIGMAYCYQYFEILDSPPNGIHSWRQSDGASIAYMYYSEDNALFEPAMHNMLSNEGKAVSEFPVLYYIVALGYEVFGFHHWVFRGFWMLICLTGLYYLYKLCDKILQDKFWSMIIAAITFTCPIFIVYGISFMPDPVAFSLLFVGLYYILKHIETPKLFYLLLSFILICLAGLLKLTILIPVIAFGTVVAINLAVKRIRYEITTFEFYKRLSPLILIVIVVSLWYLYARWYNENNSTAIFLLNARPYWELTKEQILAAKNGLTGWIIKDAFHPDGLNVLKILAVLVILPFFRDRLGRSFSWFFIFSMLGVLLYMLLFFRQFDVHDYYIISVLFLVPLILVLFIKKYKFFFYKQIASRVFLQLAGIFLFFICFNYADSRAEARFSIQESWLDLDLYELRDKLDEYGINRNDLLLVPHDPSTNITLYALDMRGWTAVNSIREPEVWEKTIALGAKYIVVSDYRYYDNSILDPYRNNLILDFKGIKIYSIEGK